MRLTLTVDGESVEVEVDADLATVELAGKRFPVKLLSSGPDRVELEVGGERVVVAGWPSGVPEPPPGVSVLGEVVAVEILHRDRPGMVRPAVPTERESLSSPPPSASPAGPGVPVHPPMPGKILEVRVVDGQAVSVGEVLLVLEAMKMRNEIPSPAPGRVSGLAVRPGDSVQARDLLLRIVAA